MLGLSWGELGVVLLVALLVLKPEDLPEVIRKGAALFRGARKMVDEVTAPLKEIAREVEQEAKPLTKIKGDDGKWYETHASEEQIKNVPDHERL